MVKHRLNIGLKYRLNIGKYRFAFIWGISHEIEFRSSFNLVLFLNLVSKSTLARHATLLNVLVNLSFDLSRWSEIHSTANFSDSELITSGGIRVRIPQELDVVAFWSWNLDVVVFKTTNSLVREIYGAQIGSQG